MIVQLLIVLAGVVFKTNNSTTVNGELPRVVADEVNRVTFDHNLHFHPMLVLSHMRFERINGPVKKEERQYRGGYEMIIEYDTVGNPTKYELSKGDSIIEWSTYEYDSRGLIRERGRFELDYIRKKGGYTLGVLMSEDPAKSYLATDTIRMRTRRWLTIELEDSTSTFSNSKVIVEYERDGQLKEIKIYTNDVWSGLIKNDYDEMGRVIAHKHFNSFSSFANEREGWAIEFRNTIHTYEYNSEGLVSKLTREAYNPLSRKWKGVSSDYEYEIEQSNQAYVITSKKTKLGEYTENKITIDSKGNWIKQELTEGDDFSLITRSIDYYNE